MCESHFTNTHICSIPACLLKNTKSCCLLTEYQQIQFMYTINHFYAQHQNMMPLLVRSSNAPDSDIKCLSLQYTTYTHTHTRTHTHTHTHTHTTSPCIYSIEGKVQQALYACTFQIFIWDWMRRCMLHVVTVHKQTCKFFRLTQVVWTCIAIVCICRSIYRWGGPAHTSAFFSLSKAHSGCKGSRREGETERHLSTSDLGRELETHTHTHTHTHAPRHHSPPPFIAQIWVIFCFVLKMGSISGRLCVKRVNNDFIHSSISEHTWDTVNSCNIEIRQEQLLDWQTSAFTYTHSHTWLKAVWSTSNVC